MHVLQIMSGYGGGISSFIENKAQALRKEDGVTFSLVAFDECPKQFVHWIEETGGRVYRLPNPKKSGWAAFLRAYREVYQQGPYDVAYCHIDGYRAWVHWWLAKWHRVPAFYIHGHHTVSYAEAKSLPSKLIYHLDPCFNRWMTRVPVACSREVLLDIFGPKTSARSSLIIPNSIPEAEFLKDAEEAERARAQLRALYPQTKGRQVIGQIGRLKKVKNHEKTLAIAKAIQKAKLPWHILVFGSGPLEGELKAAIRAEHLEDVISLVGRYQPISDVYPLFSTLLLPSYREGLPTVAIEGQAAGVPVILSDTISRETDMGLGLLHYLPLACPAEKWRDALVECMQVSPPPPSVRLKALQAAHFTNRSSLLLYIALLKGESIGETKQKAGED